MIPGSRAGHREGLRRGYPRLDHAHLRATSSAATAGSGTCPPPPGTPSTSGSTTPSPATRSYLRKPPSRCSRRSANSGWTTSVEPRRQAGRAQGLVARARPARGRRGPRPADRLGPVHQLRSRPPRRSAWTSDYRDEARRAAREAARPEDRHVGPAHGMDDRAARPEESQHRHTSHLFAVYPGRQIRSTTTPELAKAAADLARSPRQRLGD